MAEFCFQRPGRWGPEVLESSELKDAVRVVRDQTKQSVTDLWLHLCNWLLQQRRKRVFGPNGRPAQNLIWSLSGLGGDPLPLWPTAEARSSLIMDVNSGEPSCDSPAAAATTR